MNLGALATGAATTTLVLGAVVSLAPGQSSTATKLDVRARKFSHAEHAYLDEPVDIGNCAQCHGSDPKGGFATKPGGHGHTPCLSSGCHAEDFLSVGARTQAADPARYARAAGICLGCHKSEEGRAPSPFRKAKADALYQNNSDPGHFVEFNHWAHAKASAKEGGCRTCHVVDPSTFALVEGAPGHGECSSCHDGTSAAEPGFAMDDCKSCHQSGSPASYFKPRTFESDVRSCGSERYRALSAKRQAKIPCFAHEREGHRTRKSGEALQCGHCHFMFESKRYQGHGYQSLLEVKQAPIMDNSRDRAHERCGTSGCHASAVDQSRGTGSCNLCHSSKSILGSLVDDAGKSAGSKTADDKNSDGDKSSERKRRRRKKSSLDDLVN